MQFNYRFHGATNVSHNAQSSDLSFAPDTLRDPTYFIAELAQPVLFREAISALNAVVVADLRYQPKDRTEYFQWLEQEEQRLLSEFLLQGQGVDTRITAVRAELNDLYKQRNEILTPFYKARKHYFDWLYQHERDAWFVLDPVITVHPDRVFFECFSQDESSYGCLSCRHDAFANIQESSFGTTNIDYSASLYNEFQKLRDYRKTEFKIDPSGFDVTTTGSDTYTEAKIDLPESWVRGFLQVSAAMTLPATRFDLHPMDVHNILFLLKRRKERSGPRALRFILTPGEPISIAFEPWQRTLVCRRSIYNGAQGDEIRIWGRRRLMVLERLIPLAESFSVQLLGTGLPSFFIANMGMMSFTLGLSGWTANDWSRQGQFNLLASRETVDSFTQQRVFKTLGQHWYASTAALAQELQLDSSVIASALNAYTQAGRVIYDLENHVYRKRELSREPLNIDALRFSSPQEENATRLLNADLVKIVENSRSDSTINVRGTVRDNAQKYQVAFTVDDDLRMTNATCECNHYLQNKLFKGPCEHILALRMAQARVQEAA
jgi:predicted nucleic acid-binding Zn finger protein